MIAELIKQNGLKKNRLIVSTWKSTVFAADEEDEEEYGCVVGEEYTMLWCTKACTTQKGRECKAGDWYLIPVKK